jgi:hypothetical protein
MICKSCQKGADWLTSVIDGGVPLQTLAYPKWCHDDCEGCDCQHKVDVQAGGKTVQKSVSPPAR